MKKILVTFSFVAVAIMMLTAISGAMATVPATGVNNSDQSHSLSIVVSPPQIILNEIYFLEGNQVTSVN